ncbi:uncharacterized protein LOC144657650 isoform X1 [Oculina patagonica]
MADAPGLSAKTTKICRFFQSKKGCKFGNECQFLHPESVSNDSGSISQEAGKVLDDMNKKPDTADLSKTSPRPKTCRFFKSKRGCKFGNECQFLHPEKVSNESESMTNEVDEPNDEQKTSDPNITDLSSKSVTPNIDNIETLVEEKGKKENKDSSDRQGLVCKFFQKKKGCLRGNRCPFVHVISGDGATSKPVTKEIPKKTSKPTLPSKKIPHQRNKVTKSDTDNKPVTKQPTDSANLQSENQNKERDKQAGGQGTPLLPKKKDESAKGTSMGLEDCIRECKRLRSTEIQQLKRRFRSQNGYCEIQENVSYKFKFKPTDPDWPFSIEAVGLTVTFPEDYPLHIFAMSLSEEQDLPTEIINFGTQKIKEWAMKQEQICIDQGILKLYFRPFLRWFDSNLESLFIDGGRQVRRNIVSSITAHGTPINNPEQDSLNVSDLTTGSRENHERVIVNDHENQCSIKQVDSEHVKRTQNNGSSDGCQMFEKEDGKTEQSLCKVIELKTIQGTQNDTLQTSTSDTDASNMSEMDDLKQVVGMGSTFSTVSMHDSNEEDKFASKDTMQSNQSETHCQDTVASSTVRRGTEIQFKGLNLEENVSTLRGNRIVLTLECNRCRQRIDQQLSVSGPVSKQCTRCASVFAVNYRPAIIHLFSSVLGYLDLDGCLPFDVVLPESELMLGCLHCSKETSVKGLQYGANRSWCTHCHTKLGFHIQSTRFQELQISATATASLKKSKDSSALSKPKKPPSSGIKEGQPLPANGSCKHYKKSFRWLRFPCCGKCYPCDLCHEEKEDHEMKYATRMVCGFCSKEQPYSQQPCSGCKAAVTKSRSAHWEGGKGCRDKVTMSRNDDKKYGQSGKTVSRKAQKQSEGKGKGKGSKKK